MERVTAMPRPDRTVSAGVSVLKRCGIGERAALDVIMAASHCAAERCKAEGAPNVEWLRLVWREASRRANVIAARVAARERREHGE